MADDVIAEAREAFELCEEAEKDNRKTALEDLKFSRLEDQWPEGIKKAREADGRPCLTIDRTKAFIRQVVNDSRQNKPAIKCHPVDSAADVETAKVLDGIIRSIEYNSNADIAYDTAVDYAASAGRGVWRVDIDFLARDAFDLDLFVNRISNPFSVWGDPYSTAADSSDWNLCFVTERISKADFEREHGESAGNFTTEGWGSQHDWSSDDEIVRAEWWTREEVDVEIVLTGDGQVFEAEQLKTDPDLAVLVEAGEIEIVKSRKSKSWNVRQRIITSEEVLEDREWPGIYIPIVPVYGDEFDIEGKRYWRSLINPAKDSQRVYNFWRTTSTELQALTPRVPFIGKKGAFATDAEKWATVNTRSHPYIEYDGNEMPTRQPLDFGPSMGATSEALQASDDMKAILGMYDASLGARSNETSGRAIMARQREGDTSTFHFIDNLSRSIRHTGRILIDLIPHVKTEPQIARLILEDGKQEGRQINQPYQMMDDKGRPMTKPVVDPETGQPRTDEAGEELHEAVMALHDLTVGRYDVMVTAGPSFTSRREEAATQMIELIRSFPAAAPVIGDLLAQNMDWPGADEVAERLRELREGEDGIPPEAQKMIQEGMERLRELEGENTELKQRLENDLGKLEIDGYKATTDRMKVVAEGQEKPEGRGPMVEMEKVSADRERMALEREKIAHEREMFYLEHDLVPPDPESGQDTFVSRQAQQHAQLIEALQTMTSTLMEVHRVVTSPRRAELERDENGRPVAATSYPVIERVQ